MFAPIVPPANVGCWHDWCKQSPHPMLVLVGANKAHTPCWYGWCKAHTPCWYWLVQSPHPMLVVVRFVQTNPTPHAASMTPRPCTLAAVGIHQHPNQGLFPTGVSVDSLGQVRDDQVEKDTKKYTEKGTRTGVGSVLRRCRSPPAWQLRPVLDDFQMIWTISEEKVARMGYLTRECSNRSVATEGVATWGCGRR